MEVCDIIDKKIAFDDFIASVPVENQDFVEELYNRGWRRDENGDKSFSCFWDDYGRSVCKNGCFY